MNRFLLMVLCLMVSASASAATYDLLVERRQMAIVPGRSDSVIAINGSVPGPTLRFKEGEEAIVRVTNRLKSATSIHWHGLLVDGPQDGAPGFNGFTGIAPGETHIYRIKVRQSGTYWYHAHSEGQEQAGQYGALIIAPAGDDPIKADAEHVILLSDHTREDPGRVQRNLKSDSGYYNWNKRTLPELVRDGQKFGMDKTMAERRAWGQMRMDATDIADVTGYALLAHGKPSAAKPVFAFTPGQRVRLRLINGSAMSFMDVRIPGVAMTVVAADGRPIQPVVVDELRMGVAETWDVIVTPPVGAHALWVETLDRRASVLVNLTSDPALTVQAPPARPKQVLLLSEMGHAMPAPGEACSAEHAAMGHCGSAPLPRAGEAGGASDPDCPAEHAAMGHCTPRSSGPRVGTAVAQATRLVGGTPFPLVDYGYGRDPMAGMPMKGMPVLGREGDTDGSGRVFGWATGAPYGARVLSMRDLVALGPRADAAPPTREIIVRLQGNMERYIWTLNGKKFGEGPPIDVTFGERVRITFINETMMAHPMHLHGMFFEVENGQAPGLTPEKNVIVVAPGRTQSIVLTANEAGEWPLHCHLLYHMNSGMMGKLVVANVASPDGKIALARPHVH
ncbi:multicopper oxidase domain-containing protein [Sandarakinorhabdus sp.]|uniref:multicopper oxidase domain-containing protein n=1 Tax=Sandarakinorhabdus sp. TaxID=1916663 RepID=UPI0033404E2C